MNAIVGITNIAKGHVENPDVTTDYLEKISSSSHLLLNIINDVLDMSAIENNKLSIAHNAFDFKTLLSGISAMYYTQCKQKGVTFDLFLSSVTEEFLIGDSLRLNQILLNLISNAYKFTPSGGRISVTVEQLEKRDHEVFMRFIVKDTGEGMSEELQSRLFKPFEQESSLTAKEHGGSGLGLSIAKNLITLMHGAIAV